MFFPNIKITFVLKNVFMHEISSKTFRGPNVKFDDDELISRLNCYCHILHNVVEVMCDIPTVKKIVKDVSALVTFLRNSGLGVKCEPQLKKYVDTRWNTVYDMFKSVLLNYSQIGKILLEKEEADASADVMQKLTAIYRVDLDFITEFLKKFKEWSLLLESDKAPTAWMVWPIYLRLDKHLKDLPSDSEIIKAMKEAGRSYISKNTSDIPPKMLHKVCTVLNPLLKNIAMSSSVDRKAVYDFIDAEIVKYDSAVDNVQVEMECEVTSNIELLNEFMGEQSAASQAQQEPSDYSTELQKYLRANVQVMDPFRIDLVKWWHENRHVYPKLFRLFLSKSGIMASSAPSERSFSTTGIIISARRASLLPETVSDMILARNKYLNFV